MEKLLQYGVKEADITVIGQDTIYSAIWNDSVFQVLQPEKYTGIFTFNDQIAYHIINALRENGYRVPEDFSIIGFDHIRGALAYLQPLTSVAGQDSERLAETTVSLLMRRIREPQQEYITEVLPVMLWEQESTVQPYF